MNPFVAIIGALFLLFVVCSLILFTFMWICSLDETYQVLILIFIILILCGAWLEVFLLGFLFLTMFIWVKLLSENKPKVKENKSKLKNLSLIDKISLYLSLHGKQLGYLLWILYGLLGLSCLFSILIRK